MRLPARILTGSVAFVLAAAAGEATVRRIDGFEVFSIPLRPVLTAAPPVAARRDAAGRWYAASVARADGVEAGWYDNDPPETPRQAPDPVLLARIRDYPNDPIGSVLVWNPLYLKQALCAGNTAGSLGILNEFFVFEPVANSPYPIFRHFPNATPPGWFTSNAFGWRGPALALEKPSNTIRIAFVGASTTIGQHGFAHSYPERIGYWLNLWAGAKGLPYRFEVINAGRTGIDSASIEAIVRQEILPVDPDLVVYYEGANQFAPGKLMRIPPTMAVKPTATFRQRWRAEGYLASSRRVLLAFDVMTGRNGYEPPKPAYAITWPDDVDERDPDPTHQPLPMDLHAVVANLDSMRTSLDAVGGELAISSFLWMVYPGMKLDLARDLTIYRYLNDTYWPATYAHMRRTADFQNRLFGTYARRYDLPYFDLAKIFPMAPELFGDAIHLTEDGMRLQGWIYLQQLVPLIDARLKSGRWPRKAASALGSDPSAYVPRLMSRSAILASCPQ